METKELKIQAPEGYCIDESKSTFEKIVFKKDIKPRSWEEYCQQQHKENHKKGYYIDSEGYSISKVSWDYCFTTYNAWRGVLPSKELAEAFLAMMQLMSLRQAWIGGVESCCYGYAIMLDVCRNIVVSNGTIHRSLTFPTQEMAEDFMNCFKDLLEIAKPLV